MLLMFCTKEVDTDIENNEYSTLHKFDSIDVCLPSIRLKLNILYSEKFTGIVSYCYAP